MSVTVLKRAGVMLRSEASFPFIDQLSQENVKNNMVDLYGRTLCHLVDWMKRTNPSNDRGIDETEENASNPSRLAIKMKTRISSFFISALLC